MSSRLPPGKVRIIAGEWRRRWLPIAGGNLVRPTTDRTRETLFNWLQPRLAATRCLDLFAGSGVLGFESVSRGAREATLVEQSSSVVAQLRTAVAMLAAETRVTVVEKDVRLFLRSPPEIPYDVVFVDPPFSLGLVAAVLPLLTPRWLSPEALIYLETEHELAPVTLPDGWRMMRAGESMQARYCLLQAGATR